MLKPYNRAQIKFALNAEIGDEGKNSKVFVAHDAQLNAELVIKQVPKAKLDPTEFYTEASTLHLSGHPNVVPIHYACEDDDYIYLAMPYYPTGSINRLMGTRFLTVREIIKYSSQFLSGLHNIHSKKLIHFDVKPDNILISNQNEALLSDFGLSKPVAPNGKAEQDRMYLKMLPPEAFNGGDQHTIAFDIYQAGLTIYRMCVGNNEFYRQFNVFGPSTAFDGSSFKTAVRNGQFPSRSDFPEHIPPQLVTVIKQCLKTDPADRYKAAVEIVNAIAEVEENLFDWQYSVAADGTKRWQKSVKGGPRFLEVSPTGDSVAKKTGPSGKEQKINKYCLSLITTAQIKSFLKEN